MHSLPFDPDIKQKEWAIIQSIAKNNNFPQHLLQKLHQLIQHKTGYTQTKKKDKKVWTTFTYHSPKIQKITNLFKSTNIGIAFKITTTLQQLINPLTSNQTSEYEKTGIYKIICNTCQKSYVGKTNRNLKSRFPEHISYIENNKPHTAYALHILNSRHEYGSINDTMTLIKQVKNPSLLLPYEQMYIVIPL
jgi:hypothetical protein